MKKATTQGIQAEIKGERWVKDGDLLKTKNTLSLLPSPFFTLGEISKTLVPQAISQNSLNSPLGIWVYQPGRAANLGGGGENVRLLLALDRSVLFSCSGAKYGRGGIAGKMVGGCFTYQEGGAHESRQFIR